MKRLVTFTCLGVAAGLLGGCAQKGVSDIMNGNTASVQQAYSNPDLSMPPDLQQRLVHSLENVRPAGVFPNEKPQPSASPGWRLHV